MRGLSPTGVWFDTRALARRAVRVAAILCLVGLWQTVPAQTFQRINQPFTCPNSENFDSIATGAYTTLNTAVGTFNAITSGVMLVLQRRLLRSAPRTICGDAPISSGCFRNLLAK